jgi:hypothetical protein
VLVTSTGRIVDGEPRVGCFCAGRGTVHQGGIIPSACPACDGAGTLTRERYTEIKAARDAAKGES